MQVNGASEGVSARCKCKVQVHGKRAWYKCKLQVVEVDGASEWF